MRYPVAETAEKHARILDQAARLFRDRGFDGVSVSEVMKATGLTHGPFYNHFASKQALMAECIEHASGRALEELEASAPSEQGWSDYVSAYLSPAHRDTPADGCLIAALGSEIARSPAVKVTLTEHVRRTLERMAGHFPWRRREQARTEAICALSTMVGAMVLARGIDDEALSNEILERVSSSLT